ncbi:MAG: hypothetical protein H6702_14760 [Myxococcales bacterium]|nr:hypothetical protein [Myxococcales bacterium]
MKHFLSTMSGAAMLFAGNALAGAGGNPPGGGGGGSGSEPEVIALILFSLIPGVYFARKAMQTRRRAEQA